MKIFISVLILFLSISSFAQQESFQKIDSIIEAKVKNDHPGIALGIVKNGEIIYTKYQGLANLQHQIKFDEKTRSNIASTAKQFTALIILDLSLKGKLNLTDDVRKYLTKIYPEVKEKITITNLLNHSSGVRDYVELLDLDGDVWWQRFGYDNDDVLELIEKQIDLGFTPGSRYGYSNTNYVLLTKVIEKITDQKFNDYSKSFFESLGMTETSFVERYMKVIPNRANPYSDWGRGEWWEVPTVTKTNGEGFLFTTLQDQLNYEIAIQKASETNNELFIKSQQEIPNSTISHYGFGLELSDRFSRKSVHHSGGTYGFHSQVYRFPEEKITIFAMSNNGNVSTNLISQSILKLILPKVDSEPKYDEKINEEITDFAVLGKYTYPNVNSVVEIYKENNQYYWKEKNFTVEMKLEKNNRFSFVNNPKLKVSFYNDKMIEFYTSGKTKVYNRIEDSIATLKDLEALVGTYNNDELGINFKLKLNDKKNLELLLSTNEEYDNVIVYNKDFMLANNYFLKINRDQFDRAVGVSLTYGRAYNIQFIKKTNLQYQPKIQIGEGSINVTNIGDKNGTTQILVTKNDKKGNEIWFKKYGGSSYDKANSIYKTENGYLIIGSTSSYGKGNYDVLAFEVDENGKKIWQKTYGSFYNDYGLAAQKTNKGFLIKGTKQDCPNNSDIHRKCTTKVWFVNIDKKGNEISNEVLEELRS